MFSRWKQLRLSAKLGLIGAGLITLYALAGFVILPLIAEAVLPDKISQRLNRPVRLDNIYLNPFSLVVAVEGLSIGEPAGTERFLAWEELFVDLNLVSGVKLQPKIAKLRLTRPYVRVARRADNTLNFSDLLTDTTPEKTPPETTSPETTSSEKPSTDSSKTVPADSSEESFALVIDHLEIVDGQAAGVDYAAGTQEEPVSMALADIDLVLQDLAIRPGTRSRINLTTRINDAADIALTGSFDVSPVQADVRLDISGVQTSWVQPYLPEAIALFVAGGSLHLSTDINVHLEPDQGLIAAVKGRAGCDEVVVTERADGSPFLHLKALSLEGIDVTYNPLALRLDRIVIEGLTQQVAIDEEGRLNLAQAFGGGSASAAASEEPPPEAAATVPSEEAASPAADSPSTGQQEEDAAAADAGTDLDSLVPFPVEIGEIVIRELAVEFSDHNIEPHFASRLSIAEGHIQGLTSRSFSGADLDMAGALDQHAPLAITGSINPFLRDLFLDTTIDLENMALSPLSVYSGKYIGRTISKGKLNLDLAYHIEEKQLRAENRILLDQFTLGQNVDSPEAVNLPVGLAVALLKDRQGEIRLDVPISGRTDDPAFSVFSLVLQALRNILVKAAASPFALVGSLVGGGEELQYIAFEYGQSNLSDQAREKVATLDELLYKRPALQLDITGYVDPVADRQALTRAQILRRLKALKWTDTTGQKNGEGMTAAEVSLTAAERTAYLRQLYAEVVLADPETGPAARPLSDPELTEDGMMAALEKQMSVPEAALRLLSQKRARSVQDYLLGLERLDPSRLFIREAGSLAPEDGEPELTQARVTLGLR